MRMDERDLQTAEENVDLKAALRDKKKRKRMHVSGKSVFELQRLMKTPKKK